MEIEHRVRTIERAKMHDKYKVYPEIHTVDVGVSYGMRTYVEKEGFLITVEHMYRRESIVTPRLIEFSEIEQRIHSSVKKVQKFYTVGTEIVDARGLSIDIKIIENE